MSGVIVVRFIYSFKNLEVLCSLFTNAVKYMACGQIFYCGFNAHPLNIIKVDIIKVVIVNKCIDANSTSSQ